MRYEVNYLYKIIPAFFCFPSNGGNFPHLEIQPVITEKAGFHSQELGAGLFLFYK